MLLATITVVTDEHMYMFLQFPHLKNEKDNEVKKPTYELIVENNQGYCHSDASRMPPDINCVLHLQNFHFSIKTGMQQYDICHQAFWMRQWYFTASANVTIGCR